MTDRQKSGGILGQLAKIFRSTEPRESNVSPIDELNSAPPVPPSETAGVASESTPTAAELIREGLRQRQQFGTAAAVPFFERAARSEPASHLPAFMLGNAAAELGDLDTAVVHYARARDTKPDDHVIRYNLGLTHLWRGYLDPAIEELAASRRINPSYQPATTSYVLALHNSDRIPPGELSTTIREIGGQFPRDATEASCTAKRDPGYGGRLKVGFVSGDFRTHSVAQFLEPILAAHQRDSFEYICYSASSQQDAVTGRLRAAADAWREVWQLSDDELIEQIRLDGVDILVDLSGYTEFNRLPVFARRAAPVQISYLGFPNSTGIPAMDFRITDSSTDPSPSADALHSESLLRMPDSQWCFRPFGAPAEPGPLPAKKNGFVTFGSFNNLIKASDTLLRCWIQILHALPNSHLRITRVRSPQRAAEIIALFTRTGVDPARIECMPYRSEVPYGAQFTGVDIALDHFPYNGVTTTCESLYVGVPVVSMYGEHCVARSGLSILKSVGLRDLAAASPTEYVSTAVALGDDLGRLEAIRSGLRARFEQSPLRDERRFAAHFEELLSRAWQQVQTRG